MLGLPTSRRYGVGWLGPRSRGSEAPANHLPDRSAKSHTVLGNDCVSGINDLADVAIN